MFRFAFVLLCLSNASAFSPFVGSHLDTIRHSTNLKAVDRRTFVETSAAGAAFIAAKPAEAIVSGSTPAGGYSCFVCSHDTPSFSKWSSIIKNFLGPDGLPVYPEDMGVIRQVFAKGKSKSGSDRVISLLVFDTSKKAAVEKFFDQKQEPWVGGRKDGWLVDPFHANYFEPKLFRGPAPPPKLSIGQGLVYGGHAFTGDFKEWATTFTSADTDKFHDSMGVFSSVAGTAIAKGSTDVAVKGVGVVHFTKTAKDATTFEAAFDDFWTNIKSSPDAKKYPGDKYVETGEVEFDFVYPNHPPIA